MLQSLVRALIPQQCAVCRDLIDGAGALCPACWRDAGFIAGLSCDACGAPLPGEDDQPVLCDDCLQRPRPWSRGAAVSVYDGTARKMVLALKHGGRTDLAPVLASLMFGRASRVITPQSVLVPVPLHRFRLLRRRYNQSALLARFLAKKVGCYVAFDALERIKATPPMQQADTATRFDTQSGSIVPHKTRGAALAGQSVVLIDDVMTTGATLHATCEAALAAGAANVNMIVLARVIKT